VDFKDGNIAVQRPHLLFEGVRQSQGIGAPANHDVPALAG